VTVDGFDVNEPSIVAARASALEHDVADRVAFHLVDGATVGDDATYDLVIALECVHDMPNPVGVLAGMRQMVGTDGIVLVVDEATAPTFDPDAGPMEQFLYGFSITTCLPDGMSHLPSKGTGTVMRPETLTEYAREAGFAGVEILPIEHEQFRIYRLTS
jgi:2-polyprenyl-3-methyl-5-hydroxy-6-metoxy-1,4-benzoquinol methylase